MNYIRARKRIIGASLIRLTIKTMDDDKEKKADEAKHDADQARADADRDQADRSQKEADASKI